MSTRQAILRVQDLHVEFKTRRGKALVLNGVDFEINAGETLCVVGESGCGKSMTALALLRLIPSPPGRISGGRVMFHDENLVQVSEARMREVRGNRISMIFQEPMTSLNPVFTVGDQIGESLRLHAGLDANAARARAIEMLQQVGIPAPERRVDEYPHQLSGGMRQRVMIAMALACRPDILIADEPTTALDVTVQAQIFDLLRDLLREKGTAIMLITHDMGAVAEMADRVMVMYAGRVIEQGTPDEVLGNPGHPYTRGLIDCLPKLGSRVASAERIELVEIAGVVPSIRELGTGCAFRERCPQAMARCAREVPPMLALDDEAAAGSGTPHGAACWLHAAMPEHTIAEAA
ncbi:ABC transporter ATP-binding protein [Verminephrobacter aporrectodeae subsp. tuberculatae]|uniref:ABC transporter ATP-binding protein n=1 Tax=Verminephrobacter aporrectodeae subsp. tuberculatae TaxID=1110392 RepID=A0ABT3KW22_9BURK|nr:ABC transporter ATP-binding protein [Verminephrobacter aporrectodeae]MCW5322099.1 ABC transporter ATP-binding protein [Verminephrobacter aporrectodeae subsp. tuberculatae]